MGGGDVRFDQFNSDISPYRSPAPVLHSLLSTLTVFTMFEGSASYKGSARVFLNNLELDRMRYIDQNRVTKLVKRFEAAGCHHYDFGDSSLAAVIDFEKFRELLAAAGFSELKDRNEHNDLPLDLPETVKFTLLYGDHRTLAAQKHLPAKERWWSVHIFNSGLSVSHA
jgi:hypothetical protein